MSSLQQYIYFYVFYSIFFFLLSKLKLLVNHPHFIEITTLNGIFFLYFFFY